MLFLGGEISNGSKLLKFYREMGWGRMFIRRKPTPLPGELWGFDNGAFYWWKQGKSFDAGTFQRKLERAYQAGTPYMAVAPDIVCGGLKSLKFSLWWLDSGRLPMDWPWYLAVQDGMKPEEVEPVLCRFAGIFIGGSDKFKATTPAWVTLARKHNKWVHFGRCSTPKKLEFVFWVGCDSADSAFMLWDKCRLERFANTYTMLLQGKGQLTLWKPEELEEVI